MQQQIQTSQIPAFAPSDVLANFPQPFYSLNGQSFLMKTVRAILSVSDTLLSSSLSLYLLSSFYTAPDDVVNLFLSSLFDIAASLPKYNASLVMQGLQAGFTKDGLQLLSRGLLGTESVIRRTEPCTVLVTPLLPTTPKARYLFLCLALKIKWPSAILKFDFSMQGRRAFSQPIALTASSQWRESVENEVEASIVEEGASVE